MTAAPAPVGDIPPAEPAEVAPVREGEHLDWPRLEAYLRERLPELDGPFSVLQFPNGAANLTYRIAFGDQLLVLRRPPFGQVAHGGHDMGREYRALASLWRGYDRAPRALHHGTDVSVIGSEFLVVEYRPGIVVWRTVPAALAGPDAGHRIGLAVVDALADLHLVDPDACGLADLGRPAGFVERQLSGWRARWEAIRPTIGDRLFGDGRDLVRDLGDALDARRPEPFRASVLHNDFKVDNCQFRPGDPDRVSSVFDWDMATLGDPLVDLGTLLNYWPSDDPDVPTAVRGLEALGLPSRDEVLDRYARRTGFDVGDVDFYEALGCWRTAVICGQLYARYVRGETADERMADRGIVATELCRRGLQTLGGRA